MSQSLHDQLGNGGGGIRFKKRAILLYAETVINPAVAPESMCERPVDRTGIALLMAA